MPVISVGALAALPGAAPARVTSRAPTEAEDVAIVRAFDADRRQRGEGIVEIRVTRHGRRVARVVAVKRPAHPSKARRRRPTARAAKAGRFDSDYFLEHPTGEWKPDRKVTQALIKRLQPIPELWDVRFRGSGTDVVRASSPGEVPSNPECRLPPEQEKGRSSFSFDVGWALGLDLHAHGAVPRVDGEGTDAITQQAGCVNSTEDDDGNLVLVPVPPNPPFTCSNTWSPDATVDGLVAPALARLTAATDRHGNHELRVMGPVVTQDDPSGSACGSPEGWTYDASGPIVFRHSILIPDAVLAKGKAFTRKVSYDLKPFCTLFATPDPTCHEEVKWSAVISFKPQPRFDLSTFHFNGPEPLPSEEEDSVGRRG